MLIHNILIVCIYHLFGWLAAPTSKGVINQNKAVLCPWQPWYIGEVAQTDWVEVMTVIGNAWKEPVTEEHCTCVIDKEAGNGYLSSDLECVGPKHNGYLRTVFVPSRDFSKTSSEGKAVHFSVSAV